MSKTVANIAAYLDSHRRVDDFQLRAEAMEFPPRQWELLSLVDGRRSAAQIAQKLELPAEVVWSHLCKLERMGLVVQNRIPCPWHEASTDSSEGSAELQEEVCMLFAPAEPRQSLPAGIVSTQVPVDKPAPASVPLPVPATPCAPVRDAAPVVQLQLGRGVRKPEASPVVAPPSVPRHAAPTPAKPAGAIQFCLGRTRPAVAAHQAAEVQGSTDSVSVAPAGLKPEPAAAAPGNAAAMTVHSAPVSAAAPASGAWPIRPVLDALRRKAGEDAMLSQLLAYRVFLRVPAQLLEDSGIRSVSLIDPNLMITSPALREALARSLQDVTGQGWPEAG